MAEDKSGAGAGIENIVKEYQVLQNGMRSMAMQLDQMQLQKADLDTAITEIEKSEGKVYLTVGGVLVETSKDDALKSTRERADLVGVRLQGISKQYNEMKEKEKKIREEITRASEQGR
jgi:prefoldin beta subunit